MKISLLGVLLLMQVAEQLVETSCPRPTLRNGRIKIRARGKMVHFRCKKRYTRYGAKYAFCMKGTTWSHPPPLCITRGCPKIESLPNMVITESFSGAMMKFKCEDGLKRSGPEIITCDGVNWNDDPPRCTATLSYSCDFEDASLCGWSQAEDDDFDWIRNSGVTPTMNTGPENDHTYGDMGIGYYMFIESSSPRSSGDQAKLISPPYPAKVSEMCVEFWYHMLGPDGEDAVGSLEVYVKPVDEKSLADLSPDFYISGNQGDQWHRGVFKIESQKTDFQLVIVGTRKEAFVSDIAIDDIRIFNCSTEPTTIAAPATSTTAKMTAKPVATFTTTTSSTTKQISTAAIKTRKTTTLLPHSNTTTRKTVQPTSTTTSTTARITTTAKPTSTRTTPSTSATMTSTTSTKVTPPTTKSTTLPTSTTSTSKKSTTAVMNTTSSVTTATSKRTSTKTSLLTSKSSTAALTSTTPSTKSFANTTRTSRKTSVSTNTSTKTTYKTTNRTVSSNTSQTTSMISNTTATTAEANTTASPSSATTGNSSTVADRNTTVLESTGTQSSARSTSDSNALPSGTPRLDSNTTGFRNDIVPTVLNSMGQSKSESAIHRFIPLIIGISCGIVVGMIVIGILAYMWTRHQRKKKTQELEDELIIITKADGGYYGHS